jgi:hypothetical protein
MILLGNQGAPIRPDEIASIGFGNASRGTHRKENLAIGSDLHKQIGARKGAAQKAILRFRHGMPTRMISPHICVFALKNAYR